MRRWLAGPGTEATPAAIAALGALMAATFCIVTTENLPAGLLPQISSGLGVSLSATGQLVTGYALTVTLLTVPLTYATRRIPRRPLLLGLMTLFVLAGLSSAAAPNFALLLASRAVTALVHAVFWAVVTVTATGLFPPSVRGRIVAMVYGAGSMATILGVPAGSWIGQQAGWRVAFVALSGIGLIALVTVVVFLPATAVTQTPVSHTTAPDTPRYTVLLVTIVLAMTGLSMAFTYTVPFLTDVSGFSMQAVSPLLLLRGVVGIASVAVAGHLADHHPKLATTVPVALLSVSLVGMYLVGTVPLLAAVLMAASGVALFTMITTLTSELLAVAPGNLYIASAGGNAVFNAGTAAGAVLGGLVLSDFGVRSVTLAGGLLAAAALAVLLADQLIGRVPRRSRETVTDSS
ncbi:MFS transporter [Streptomyces sp. SID2888]|uniref:MFS transporter n=1 Tax=Streptomyces sp. SID2888 TaxID=2690256 RepID=UPI001369A2E1|nr:MFS transporter [Streptomyces sp. SID2888]